MMNKRLLTFILGCVFLAAQTYAQQKTVSGKVTSAEDRQPLPGVSVKIKGAATGTSTNVDGNYSISASPGQVLVFSFVGAKAEERTVGAASTINVSLTTNASALNEVVVTAYGIDRDKKSLGYSAPVVKGDEVSETQRESFFGGLQGRVPGLSVNPSSGNPGASSQIVLRGFVSISGDNNALIVVDGVPINNSSMNQLNLVTQGANRDQDYTNRGMDINPADIETYTIMKGPEATALYGNSGASGAIIITTKKGKAGRGSISYNNSFRIEKITRWPEIQQEFNSGSNGVYAGNTTIYGGPRFLPGTKIYDNIQEFFQDGFAQKHNLSVEGGSEKLTYRWSNEYSANDGVIPITWYKRFSSRLTGSVAVSPILKVTSTFNYMNIDNRKAYKGANSPLMEISRFSSAYDVNYWQDPTGNRVLHVGNIYDEFDNPLWDQNKNPDQDKTNRLIANTNVQLTPNKWLTITGIGGIDYSTTTGMQVFHAQSYRGSGSASAPTGGRIVTYDNIARILNGSLTAVARHKFGNFNNTYIVGGTISDNISNTPSQMGTNMYDPNFYSINNTLLTTQRTWLNVNNYRNIGAFAQAVMGYKTLLFLTLTERLDGASRLMPNNPYFAYPSASVAFNFTDLDYFKNGLPWLYYGKLRASYAQTGKEPWRTYSTASKLEPASTTGGGFKYSYYGGNPELKPEISKNFEIGTELQFLKNRIGFDFNYYHLRSEDQIINPRLSYGSGWVLEMMNGGVVVNKGIEVQVNANPIRRRDFNWDLTINYTQNRGTVLSVAEELPELYESDTWVLGGVRSAVHPGYSTGTISGTKFDRNIYGDILITPSSGLPTSTDAKYYPIGDRTPKFTLGLVNRFNYKSWNLSFLWDLRYGGDVLNGTEYVNYTRGISVKTLDRETPRVITGVLKDGLENTDHPTVNTIAVTPYSTTSYYTTNVSPEMFVERNIKSLRLRDVTLSYDFSPAMIKKIRFVQGLGAFITVTDAVMFTNYSGIDPESNMNTPGVGGIGGYGLDYGNLGRPIGMNFGLRVKL